MMKGMRPDQAKQFYEEDEDPKKVFALFDAARQQGKLSQTRRSERRDLMPLSQLAIQLLRELRRDLHELRLGERVARGLDRAADTLRSKAGVR